jgi:hypothetical protein
VATLVLPRLSRGLTTAVVAACGLCVAVTLVAVNDVWLGYDAQVFLRSTDGLTWDTLPAGSFAPSHPIFFITHGFAEASDACTGAG